MARGDRGIRPSMKPKSPTPSGPRRAGPVEPHSTGPVFVGATTAVQIAVTRPIDAQITQPADHRTVRRASGSLGYRPVAKGQPLAQNISAVLISPPQEPPRKHWTPPSGVIMPGQAPSFISREEWGADPVSAMRYSAVSQRSSRRDRPSHRGQQRLLAAGLGGHHQVDLHVPHQRPWAGATSRTTPWSTNTARCSRAAPGGSTNPSWAPTPAGSTAIPGVWP